MGRWKEFMKVILGDRVGGRGRWRRISQAKVLRMAGMSLNDDRGTQDCKRRLRGAGGSWSTLGFANHREVGLQSTP